MDRSIWWPTDPVSSGDPRTGNQCIRAIHLAMKDAPFGHLGLFASFCNSAELVNYETSSQTHGRMG